jgi:hypothetical protein
MYGVAPAVMFQYIPMQRSAGIAAAHVSNATLMMVMTPDVLLHILAHGSILVRPA